MKRVLWGLAFVVGGFLVVRALIEPFVIDFSDPSSYEDDWGGPGLLGVLAVHMGPGVLAAALFVYRLTRSERRRSSGSPADG